jgi:protease I
MRKKIGILIENRFIEREIYYYQARFAEEGYEVVLLTRLWNQPQLTFKGLELGAEITANNSFEYLTENELSEYAAIIAPAGYVLDYLLYSEKPCTVSPAAKFIECIMKDKNIVKGFICHSLWLAAPVKDVFKNRVVTCHNNIISHVKNAGMTYVDRDIRDDEDLITARTGGDYPQFVRSLLEKIRIKNGG